MQGDGSVVLRYFACVAYIVSPLFSCTGNLVHFNLIASDLALRAVLLKVPQC